ncbi:hypothetical protein N7523_010380 [Penicillium sp. IBT 18751x]|nr:hypothetical protein N7523_010380 [Penicillium sp. IBT 18751x]
MKRPHVEFALSDPQRLSAIYKTDDIIDGKVLFTPHQRVKAENVTISFQGAVRTEVENMYTHVPVSTNVLEKPFLRMDFPVFDSVSDTTLEPERTYEIPFKFVVPRQLPVQMCHHECVNVQIQQEHLQLPASLGHVSRMMNVGDDMSPETAKVMYFIKFEVWDSDALKGRQAKKAQEAICPVHILPVRQESAPLLISQSRHYKLQTKKNTNRGMLRSNVGALVASAAQPPAIQLDSLQPKDASSPLKINLRFEPTHEGQLPPTHLSTQFKLKSLTFYGLEPWHEFPDLQDASTWGPRRAVWSDRVPLSSMEMELEWSCQIDHGRVIYTASADLVVDLASSRLYPPTFHSCFISRVYVLKAVLFLSVHRKATRGISLSLAVPLQICAL